MRRQVVTTIMGSSLQVCSLQTLKQSKISKAIKGPTRLQTGRLTNYKLYCIAIVIYQLTVTLFRLTEVFRVTKVPLQTKLNIKAWCSSKSTDLQSTFVAHHSTQGRLVGAIPVNWAYQAARSGRGNVRERKFKGSNFCSMLNFLSPRQIIKPPRVRSLVPTVKSRKHKTSRSKPPNFEILLHVPQNALNAMAK